MQRFARAFTLIELMIVVAVIAILAAILIPNFLHARAETQTTSCEATERQIATAIEEYAVDHGTYPATAAVTPAMFGVGTSYLSSTPVDPINGTQYQYTLAAPDCTTPGTKYEIIDSGGHDPTAQIANAALGSTTIYYCSGSGLSGK
jgi:prepilin-type N-terminal cleavage/methylation domain-containing protein